MKIIESIISFLQFKMSTPTMYGWFHLMCLFIMILLIILLLKIRPNSKKLLLTFSIIMLFFELYKQLSFSFNDGIWNYQWYVFPFQFCSVPMYVMLLASLIINKKIEYNLYCFLATYSLVGGLSVMLYPNDVYISEVFINIQTMIHHGFMVVVGVYLLANKDISLTKKTLFNAFKVFIVLVFIALFINIITYYIGIDGGLKMFFISPFHASTLPVFDVIYAKVPYLIFLSLYVLVFTFGASLPILIFWLINKIKYNFRRINK